MLAVSIGEIGSVCSIVSLALALVAVSWRGWKWFVHRERKLHEQLKRRIDLYRSASGNLGARTDLGFFLHNELSFTRTLIVVFGQALWAVAIVLFFLQQFSYQSEEPWKVYLFNAMMIPGVVLALLTANVMFRAMKMETELNSALRDI